MRRSICAAAVIAGIAGFLGYMRVPLPGAFPIYDLADECCWRHDGSVDEALGASTKLWPSAMGVPGNYGNSKHLGPKNLTEGFSWSWADQRGRFFTPGIGGTVIDDEKNVYLGANSEIVKFSPNGQVLWKAKPVLHCGVWFDGGFMMNSPSLWGDAIFSATEQGTVFALSAKTGREIWSRQYLDAGMLATKYGNGLFNNGFVQVSEGVVVVDGINKVYGFKAVDGTPLWNFEPEVPVWNFKADFPGDGTFVFQTWSGQAYRCRLSDGSLIWKAGGEHGTWTDGNIALGPNNIVYAVNTKWVHPVPQPTRPMPEAGFHIFNGAKGQLTAFALKDGKRLWSYDFDKPPNNAPAIGRLSPGAGYSVIQPIGQQDRQWEPYFVYAFDAETGKLQWRFDGPIQKGLRQATDDLSPSQQQSQHVNCVPNPWSAPTIDASGTVYIANQEGPVYALRDVNEDGRISGTAEVHSYNTSRAFCGSEAPSIVPGLMAIASCDTMFVWRYPET